MKTVVDLATALKTYFLEKDTAAKQAVEATIAPVESDASSSAAAYSVGDQLILNDILYDVTASILISDALVVGTNIAAANDLSTQIGSKQDQIEVTSMPTASASNIGQVLIYIGATTSTYTSGQSYQSTLEGGSYIWKPTGSGAPTAAAVSYDGTQSGSSETNVQGAIDDLYSQKQTLETAISNEVTARTNADALKANKTDLASISITGNTNNTGSKIPKGTFFYKSGVFARAILDIANGATLTVNTNYKLVTDGGLNETYDTRIVDLYVGTLSSTEASQNFTISLSPNDYKILSFYTISNNFAQCIFATPFITMLTLTIVDGTNRVTITRDSAQHYGGHQLHLILIKL